MKQTESSASELAMSSDQNAMEIRRVKRLVLATTSVSYVMVILDTSVVNVALEDIAKNLAVGIVGLQWIVNAYTLSFAGLLLSGGVLGDRLGVKRMYLIGLAVFTAASALCAISSTPSLLILGRVAQGAGAALLAPCSLNLINRVFRDQTERAKAIAFWAGCGGVALAAGPVAGGLLTSSLGWQSIFWINVPIGLLGIVLTLFVGSDRGWTVGRHLDLMGQGLAAICLISAIGVLIEGPELGWSSASIIIGGMVAIIALVGFVLAEKRHLEPMLPLMIFKNSAFAGIAIVTVMGTMAWFGMLFVLSLYFQKERGLTPFQTGLAFLPGTAVVILGNILFGRLVGRMGLRWVLLAGTVAQAVGFFGILLIQQGTSYVWIAICLLVLGLGGGLRTPAAAAAVINSVAGAHVGIAAGVLNASRQVGAALGVALFGSFIVEAQALGTGVRLSAAVSFAASAVSVAIMFYALKKDES